MVVNSTPKTENMRETQIQNIDAAKTVADVIRTCLGPRAMLKMVLRFVFFLFLFLFLLLLLLLFLFLFLLLLVVVVSKTVADVIRTCLGPRAMLKMVLRFVFCFCCCFCCCCCCWWWWWWWVGGCEDCCSCD